MLLYKKRGSMSYRVIVQNQFLTAIHLCHRYYRNVTSTVDPDRTNRVSD